MILHHRIRKDGFQNSLWKTIFLLSKCVLFVSAYSVSWVSFTPTCSGEVKNTAEEELKLRWKKPRFSERQSERNMMVSTQIQREPNAIRNNDVLAAMRAIPRHMFVPKPLQSVAYANRPLPIGSGQTISQPFIVAYMTEKLEIKKGDKVLEIGTGSGYQAAVLSELTPHVYSIEILKKLGKMQGKRLHELGYKTITFKIGDGYHGWEEHAPFDAIMVTCASGHIPQPLLKQLKPGGRMIIPVGGVYDVQMLLSVAKDLAGEIKTRQLLPVRFVPMTGQSQK